MSQSPSLQTTFPNRIAAGKALIGLLQDYADRRDAIVLALPRGGVPVAFAVANALQLDLDLMVVRKLGVPGHEEFALGAIAPGGVEVFNEDVVYHHALDQANIGDIVEREQRELARREQVYRGNRPPPQLKGKVVILMDDGLATGACMKAAIHAVRQQAPLRIVVAVPVAPAETVQALRDEVDDLVCVLTPDWMVSIGYWYQDFSQVSDEQVVELLQCAWQPTTGGTAR